MRFHMTLYGSSLFINSKERFLGRADYIQLASRKCILENEITNCILNIQKWFVEQK